MKISTLFNNKALSLIFILLILSFVLPIFLTPTYSANNENTWNFTLVPTTCLTNQEYDKDGKAMTDQECGLNEMMQVAVNVSQIILALTGSAALLMFAYGGVMFIISAGNQERVQKAKTILTAAVIGIIIIFGSWIIVNFTILTLTGKDLSGTALIFGKNWSSTKSSDQKTKATGKEAAAVIAEQRNRESGIEEVDLSNITKPAEPAGCCEWSQGSGAMNCSTSMTQSGCTGTWTQGTNLICFNVLGSPGGQRCNTEN